MALIYAAPAGDSRFVLQKTYLSGKKEEEDLFFC
jgi:hypothetical protein